MTNLVQIDEFMNHFPLTDTGKRFLLRRMGTMMELQISAKKSLYDLNKTLVQGHVRAVIKEHPWVAIN